MPIILSLPSTPDAITTYDGLIEAIVYTLKDSTLADQAPRFIYLAEARFKRLLYTLEQEVTAESAAAASVALPSDYKHLRSIRIDDDAPMAQLSPDDFHKRFANGQSGKPEAFCIQDDAIILGPSPDASYTVSLSYIATLVNLSTNTQTNWLLERHPDLYLYGSLVHAELYGWNDERIPLFENAVDTIIGEINAADAKRRRGTKIEVVAGDYF